MSSDTTRPHLFLHAMCGARVGCWLSDRRIVSHPGTTDGVERSVGVELSQIHTSIIQLYDIGI